jgi:hypothetical protein
LAVFRGVAHISLRRLLVSTTLVLATLTVNGSAGSANPWRLRCASMPAEQAVPAPARRAFGRFYPWVNSKGREALRSGPVYLMALSTRTAVSRDGDPRDALDYYDHRALLAVSPSYKGAITITGKRIARPGSRATLAFSTDGAGRCTVFGATVNCATPPVRFAPRLHIPGGNGWRIVQSELRIGRTGCFRITATGRDLHASIPLAVPGPDWGTPGW